MRYLPYEEGGVCGACHMRKAGCAAPCFLELHQQRVNFHSVVDEPIFDDRKRFENQTAKEEIPHPHRVGHGWRLLYGVCVMVVGCQQTDKSKRNARRRSGGRNPEAAVRDHDEEDGENDGVYWVCDHPMKLDARFGVRVPAVLGRRVM